MMMRWSGWFLRGSDSFARERTFVTKATLLVIQGVDQGARFDIGSEPVILGRGVPSGIRVLDTEVSREHATILCDNDSFVLSDTDSANGTFVNGVAIRRRKLSSGDQIQLGRSVLLFTRESDDAPEQVADQIHLVGAHSSEDRSSIVGEVSQEMGRTLLSGMPQAPTAENVAQTLLNLRTLYRISEEVVSPAISPSELLQRILTLTIEVVGADRGCILVSDPKTHKLVPQVFHHRKGVDASGKMAVSRTIVDYVLRNGQGVRTSDARTDRRFEPGQSILQAGICEAMCVPMQGHNETLGAVYVDTTTPPEQVILNGNPRNKFSEEQLTLVVAIGRQAALAIENSRYQQALVNAERLAAMGQTIAMLSHHIKNILQGVRGGSYLIDMGLNDHNEEFVRKGWGIVEKNQSKIYHLVMDMLTFSKERQPVLQPASLNDTVQEVAELMQSRAEECGIEFGTDLSQDMPTTTFDAEGIHRAVLNIVINAMDAVEGSDRGAVLIKTGHEPASDDVYVAVIDSGPGIPKEHVGKIFDVFESTKGSRGTGLGLAASRKILHEHGGGITVESKPGEGCKFVLSWPRTDEDQQQLEGPTKG
jgi:signal transduction histidine kinase/pSer/pThr/pTyr-binding forkhead associated (FHA) protein